MKIPAPVRALLFVAWSVAWFYIYNGASPIPVWPMPGEHAADAELFQWGASGVLFVVLWAVLAGAIIGRRD